VSSKKESLEARYLEVFYLIAHVGTRTVPILRQGCQLIEIDQNLKFNEALHYMKSVGILIWITYLYIYI
jgi:hypothetical protein